MDSESVQPAARWKAPQIGSLSLRDPVHVSRQESLQTAASLMRRERISALVVDTHPVSFLTEQDVVRAVAEGRALTDPVSTVATRGPVWVPPTLTVTHAAALMVGVGIRHLLIVAPIDEVVGVLSMTDAFEALLGSLDVDGWLAACRSVSGDVG